MQCTFCGSKQTEVYDKKFNRYLVCCVSMEAFLNGNKHPLGKIDATDEGVQPMAIYVKNNRIILDFNTDLSWIGFDKMGLTILIQALTENLKLLT
jgi:hypothetical protein